MTFKDINGLVEQNVQLRSLVRDLSNQIESEEMEFKVTRMSYLSIETLVGMLMGAGIASPSLVIFIVPIPVPDPDPGGYGKFIAIPILAWV